MLVPRTWYGLPAYAKEGKERNATFGFDQAANLEAGTMWPTSWFLTKLTKTRSGSRRSSRRRSRAEQRLDLAPRGHHGDVA
jgi:hypothetical protein